MPGAIDVERFAEVLLLQCCFFDLQYSHICAGKSLRDQCYARSHAECSVCFLIILQSTS